MMWETSSMALCAGMERTWLNITRPKSSPNTHTPSPTTSIWRCAGSRWGSCSSSSFANAAAGRSAAANAAKSAGRVSGVGVEQLSIGAEVQLVIDTLYEDDDTEFVVWK